MDANKQNMFTDNKCIATDFGDILNDAELIVYINEIKFNL